MADLALLRGGAVVVSWMVLSGCGSGSTRDNGFDAGAGDDGAVAGDSGVAGDVGTFGDDGGVQGNLSCSGDLQSVVDQNGVVVKQCPSDQGCSGGVCIPACQAAAAAHGSIGCDFVAATPAFETSHTSPCFVVFLANSWTRPVQISVQRAGMTYDATKFARVPTVGTPTTSWPTLPPTGLPPNQVAVMFLSSDPAATNIGPINCPVPDAIASGTSVMSAGTQGHADTGIGEAFHITTDTPVNGYDVIPYGGARSYLPSAELLLPSTAWGTNYVMSTPMPGRQPEMWGQVVAAQDGTTVKVVPKVALPSGTGVPAAPAGTVTSFTLNAGQYVQWQMTAAGTSTGDFSGSILSSDKPVGVNAGNGILCQVSATSPSGGGCDSEHEMVPPVSAMGSEYVAAPFATRALTMKPESLPYRIVGTVAGTTLTYDPPVTGAPASLGVGQVVDFEATGAFRVASQDATHPFYVAQMMPGCLVTGGSRPGVDPSAPLAAQNCLGDEEYLGVIPPAQWLQKYVFFTDPTYATTNIVLVRQKTAAGFQDVNVDCLGNATGWTPVGASGTYEATNLDFIRATVPVGNCNNGPHVAKSTGPFALVVWGMDSFSSYGYPAGGNFRTINTVVVPLPQ